MSEWEIECVCVVWWGGGKSFLGFNQSIIGVVWCGVVWSGVVWCGVVWCGVVLCCVVWCGVVWSDVVWCGVVMRPAAALPPSTLHCPSVSVRLYVTASVSAPVSLSLPVSVVCVRPT